MIKRGDRYVIAASEITGRMRSSTEDAFMATGPTPYGPFTRRFLAVPHAGRTSLLQDAAGSLLATYNPQCADRFAIFCEQVGFVRLEQAADRRLRPDSSVLTEGGATARLQPVQPVQPVQPAIPIRDPSIAHGPDGTFYLVGTTGKNREGAGELAL